MMRLTVEQKLDSHGQIELEVVVEDVERYGNDVYGRRFVVALENERGGVLLMVRNGEGQRIAAMDVRAGTRVSAVSGERERGGGVSRVPETTLNCPVTAYATSS